MHRLALLALSFSLAACAIGTDDDDAELREAESKSSRPPNAPAGYDRVRARIKCDDAQLRYRPEADALDNRVIGKSDSLLHRGRYVFVQGRVGSDGASPGNIGGYVWINPDESLSNVPEAERAGYESRHPDVGHRGFVPDGCLEPVPGETASIPTPSTSTSHPNGNAKPWGGVGTVKLVRHGCVVDGTYHGVRDDLKSVSFSYAPYGTKGTGDAIPISFSTTVVEGGGTIFGYVYGGDAVHVVYESKSADANQLSGSVPAKWSYVYAPINGHTTYGWLWSSCLEDPKVTSPAPAPSTPAPEAPGASCYLRCCDGSLHEVNVGSATECRNAYAVCASHGRTLRIKYGASYIYDKGSC